MKKILFLFVLSLLCFVTLGCGGKTEKTEPIEVLDLGDYTGQKLEITSIDKGFGTDFIKQAVKVFNKSTGSEIIVKTDETLNESIARTLDVGTNVSDIYITFSHDYQWVDWSQKGYIVDISDVIPDSAFLNEEVAKLGKYEGKRYYYPISFAPTGFVYNQDYLDMIPSNKEYHQGEFPETFQGLLDLCEACMNAKIMNNGQQVAPLSYGATVSDIFYLVKGMWKSIDPDGYSNYFQQNDVNGIDGDANKALIVNDNFKTVINKLHELFNPKQNANGDYYPSYCVKDATGQNNLDAEESFLNGYSLFTLSGSWFENEMKDQIEDTEADFYHFAPVPAMNEGGKPAVFINLGDYICVTAKGKNNNIELAKAFIKYFFSERSCISIHSNLQTPIPYKYDMSKVSLTVFGKEVADVVQNVLLGIEKTDTAINLSGALDITIMNADFLKLAVSPSVDANSILEKFYNMQKQDWKERLKKFNVE